MADRGGPVALRSGEQREARERRRGKLQKIGEARGANEWQAWGASANASSVRVHKVCGCSHRCAAHSAHAA